MECEHRKISKIVKIYKVRSEGGFYDPILGLNFRWGHAYLFISEYWER